MPINPPPRRAFFLAIRHRPSGGLLPAVRGYGFTRGEPTLEDAPRLWTKMGPCRQALDRWLEGAWYEKFDDDEGQLKVDVIPKPGRRRADMEVVEVEVVIRTLTEAQLRVL